MPRYKSFIQFSFKVCLTKFYILGQIFMRQLMRGSPVVVLIVFLTHNVGKRSEVVNSF